MKISYSIDTSTTMYNRKYAKNKVQAKSLKITLSCITNESISADSLKGIAEYFDGILDGGIIVGVQDPYMVQVLEPKSGATVHNRLNELKRTLIGKTSTLLGTTVPPETLNGYRVLVMGDGYDVTLEGLAELILRSNPDTVTHVVISDGSITTELDHNDLKEADAL